MKKYLFLFITTFFTGSLFAQQLTIKGKVIDEKTTEPLIGAVVKLESTTIGTTTDMNGEFQLNNLKQGVYGITVSYLSYVTKNIQPIAVNKSETSALIISLQKTSNQLGMAVIRTTPKKESTIALVNMQKNSSSVSDGISAEIIKRTPDKNTSDVLKRVSGASIQDNKFAIIRGLNDRYNMAILNGAVLPSSESDRKAFAFDIFPSALLDNLIITKTATPDMPAEFAGGIIQINTRDVPERNFFSASLTGGYNTLTTGNTLLMSNGGSKDWMGLDDGSRALPDVIPTQEKFPIKIKDQADLAKKMAPADWGVYQGTFQPNKAIQVSTGASKSINNVRLAAIGALTYSRSSNYQETIRRTYSGNDSTAITQIQTDYLDKLYSRQTLIGLMGNLFLQVNKNNSISFKNLYSINADDRLTNREGSLNPLETNPTLLKSTNAQFTSNKIYSGQLSGEHFISAAKVKVTWGLASSTIHREIPYERRMIYTRNKYFLDTTYKNPADTTYTAAISTSNVGADYAGGMFWFFNDEKLNTARINFSRIFKTGQLQSELKIGGLYQERNREFSARRLGYTKYGVTGGTTSFKDSLLYLPEDQIFAASNMGIIKNAVVGGANGIGGFKLLDGTRPSDAYQAKSFLTAAYIMADQRYKFLRAVYGVRVENFLQTMEARKNNNTTDDLHLHQLVKDYLPSLNLIAAVTKKQNVRLSYYQTVNRPEYRELAPFAFFDFNTQYVISGNDSLSRALINNYDVRYEYYPGRGQILSVSGFYKKFENPIEQIALAYTDHEITFTNLKSAVNYGFEAEARVLVSSILPVDSFKWLQQLTVYGNLALVNSAVNTGGVSGINGDKRPLQGQSPYVMNMGLYYVMDPIQAALSINVNRVAQRVYIVGSSSEPALWEAPRTIADLQLVKYLWKRKMELKFNVQNIFAQNQVFYQNRPEGETTIKANSIKGKFNNWLFGDPSNANAYHPSKDDMIWSVAYGRIFSIGLSIAL